MKIIDTHSHLYVEEFDADRSDVVERARQKGVSRVIMPAMNLQTMPALLEMCRQYPDFCSPLIGLHPEDVDENYLLSLSRMYSMLQDPSSPFIGIGEIGLDFYWDQTFKTEQLDAFQRQLEWAVECDKPVVIHARSAHQELVNTLYKYRGKQLRGIFHCFGGTESECRDLLDFEGFLFGIGGVLTFKKSTLPEIVKKIPLSRIVLETDSPYLAPVPYRGKRNESSYICATLQKLAEVLELPLDYVAHETSKNAERLFGPASFL